MNFADITGITIPEGEVVELTVGGVTVWTAAPQYTYPEYIELNDDIAFNTGHICDQDTKIELVFTRADSSARYLFGVASSDNKASFTGYQSGNASGSWRFGGAYARPPVPVNQENTVVMSKSGIVMNGTAYKYTGTIGTFTTPHPLAVGGCMGTGGTIGATTHIGRLYRFRLWQGDALVMDWVPCVRGDGVQGFWDNASGEFVAPA